MFLYNRINRQELRKKAAKDPFRRITLSFYRYERIADPSGLRNSLYKFWQSLNVLGRIYIAREGINAQLSVPEHSIDAFISHLYSNPLFSNIPIKKAIEEEGNSFFKLTVKVKNKIVADGLNDSTFNPGDTGKRVDAVTFHNMADEAIVVDMRNSYESEVGHFDNAICPDVKTFREALPRAVNALEGKEHQNILLYCTGGIRCEKASAWLKHNGFKNVYQLDGGIIEYTRQIKEKGLKSKFRGKNFVFDERMGERITNDILGRCHHCGAPSDRHVNCAHQPCHTLIIQCTQCSETMHDCCSEKCRSEYISVNK